MSRKAFDERDFARSMTLRNVSANLDLIRRMEHLSLAELGKITGLSDRHLDSLIRMTSNVSVLVVEQIAERLQIPFLRFIGTRLDENIPGAKHGLLKSLREEKFDEQQAIDDAPAADVESLRKDLEAEEPIKDKEGLEAILARIVDVQDRLGRDHAATDAKVDRLADQVQNLVAIATGKPKGGSAAKEAIHAKAPKERGGRRAAAKDSSGEAASKTAAKSGRGRSAKSAADHLASKRRSVTAQTAEADLFDQVGEEIRRKRRGPAKGATARPMRAAAKARRERSKSVEVPIASHGGRKPSGTKVSRRRK